jgi:hypothetical protein
LKNPVDPTRVPPLRVAVVFVSVVLILITVSAYYFGGVNQLNTGLPLVPLIVTDKDQYRVGEDILATLLYVNPNPRSVSFTPPSHYLISFHEWPLSNLSRPSGYSSIPPEEAIGSAQIDRIVQWVVVSPNEEFKVLSYTFTALREGTFLVTLGDVSKQIQVIG